MGSCVEMIVMWVVVFLHVVKCWVLKFRRVDEEQKVEIVRYGVFVVV